MDRLTKLQGPERTGGISDGFTKMARQPTGQSKARIKQRSMPMAFGNRFRREHGSLRVEPASLSISKAVARTGARLRLREPVSIGKGKSNTNVHPGQTW